MSIQGFSQPHQDLGLWASDADAFTAQEVRAYLSHKGIWFIPCLGMYEGVCEMSYLTAWTGFLDIAGELCQNQESVLRLGSMDSLSRRKATLLYARDDGYWQHSASVDLGRLYSIPAADIHKHDAWTIPLQQAAGDCVAFVCGHPDKFGQMMPPVTVKDGIMV